MKVKLVGHMDATRNGAHPRSSGSAAAGKGARRSRESDAMVEAGIDAARITVDSKEATRTRRRIQIPTWP